MRLDEILFSGWILTEMDVGISRHFGQLLAPNSSSDFFDLWECEIFLFVCLGRFLTKKPANWCWAFKPLGTAFLARNYPRRIHILFAMIPNLIRFSRYIHLPFPHLSYRIPLAFIVAFIPKFHQLETKRNDSVFSGSSLGGNSPWVPVQGLVLVLQYCPGGNLSNLLQREGQLPEALARLYTAEANGCVFIFFHRAKRWWNDETRVGG